MDSTHLNILLVGASGVGKSAFLERHKFGTFSKKEQLQYPVALKFETNHGQVNINVYESDIPEDVDIHGLITMFSKTDLSSFQTFLPYLHNVQSEGVPNVVCGNKSDIKFRQVTCERIEQDIITHGMKYVDMSAKSNFNYEKPFLYIVQKCLDKEDLKFVSAVPIEPPVFEWN